MTTPVLDANDYLGLVANIHDAASLRLFSKIIEGQITMMEAQLNQLQQLSASLKERLDAKR